MQCHRSRFGNASPHGGRVFHLNSTRREGGRCLVRAASQGSSPGRAQELVDKAVALYEEVWTKGRVLMLDSIMAEDHIQADMVWQPDRRASGGRRGMKRGILAYRGAYPDIRFKVLCASLATPHSHGLLDSAEHSETNDSSSGRESSSSHQDSQGTVASSSSSASESSSYPTAGVHTPSHPSSSVPPEPSMAAGAHAEEAQAPMYESVFVHWAAEGTNLGPIREAPPSGKKVSFSGISRLDFDAEGRIMRSNVYRQAPVDEAAYFLSQGISPGSPRTETSQQQEAGAS
mmetsp:Transcript_2312/g.5212  ORF Transcript_2312/g.5212 Transcript_2312/m.5212 type:complete len:288 (+) Transcript_2312:75-938(+)